MAIPRFTLVELVAASGGKPTVQAWTPGASEQPGLDTAHRLLGVTMTVADNDEPVACMKRGYLRDVVEQNGETWAVGEALWALSGGSISHTRPTAPLPFIVIGAVYAGPDGSDLFMVDVDVRVLPSLGELSGVLVEAPEDLDVFVYDDAADVWEPRRLVGEDVSCTPSGSLEATDMQAAIDELEAQKTGRRWLYAMKGF